MRKRYSKVFVVDGTEITPIRSDAFSRFLFQGGPLPEYSGRKILVAVLDITVDEDRGECVAPLHTLVLEVTKAGLLNKEEFEKSTDELGSLLDKTRRPSWTDNVFDGSDLFRTMSRISHVLPRISDAVQAKIYEATFGPDWEDGTVALSGSTSAANESDSAAYIDDLDGTSEREQSLRMSARVFLVEGEDITKIPLRAFDPFFAGAGALPEFAGRTIVVAWISYTVENRKPKCPVELTSMRLKVTSDGFMDEDYYRATFGKACTVREKLRWDASKGIRRGNALDITGLLKDRRVIREGMPTLSATVEEKIHTAVFK